jgi:hypothetical protein
MPAYKRILLKLSGEALMGDDAFGINRATIVRMVEEIAEVTRLSEWPCGDAPRPVSPSIIMVKQVLP